jgi:chloramphenicol 3-O-phosphotransferase
VFDGVTLSNGDRILLTGQTTTTENGAYVFNGSASALTRTTDYNTSAQINGGDTFWVNEGTTYGDTGWTLTTNGTITLGSTGLTYTQSSGLGQVSVTGGLTKTGNALAVGTASASRIVINANSIDLATTGVSANTYTKVTVDAYGRVTAGATATAADVGAQASSSELSGLALLASNGIVARTAAGTYTARTITGTAGRITVSNGDGVAGAPTLDLATSGVGAGTYTKVTVDVYGRVTTGATATAADVGAQASSTELTGLAALASNGIVARTAAGTYAARTLTGSARITVTNGDGVAGAPTFDLPTGVMASPGTYNSVTVDTYGRVTAGSNVGSSTDQAYSTLTNNQGATISICQAVYSDTSGTVKLAVNTAAASAKVIGLVVSTSITNATSGNIATDGVVTATTGQWDTVTGQTGGLTTGAVYYLDSTAGKLSTTAPSSGWCAQVGVALSSTKMSLTSTRTVRL